MPDRNSGEVRLATRLIRRGKRLVGEAQAGVGLVIGQPSPSLCETELASPSSQDNGDITPERAVQMLTESIGFYEQMLRGWRGDATEDLKVRTARRRDRCHREEIGTPGILGAPKGITWLWNYPLGVIGGF
jgi:hypothetical protein